MVGKTKAANAADKRRMGLIGEQHFGCIPCLKYGRESLATVQHVTEGFKRKGHHATYGCCTWHHFGTPFEGYDRQRMTELIGPSLAFNRREYKSCFGGEVNLIAVQDWLLECYNESPWPTFCMPVELRIQAAEWLNAELQNRAGWQVSDAPD